MARNAHKLPLCEQVSREGIQLGVYYVYEHWRPDLGTCFYVGKGKRNRARTFSGRNTRYQRIAKTLSRKGLEIEVRMVASGLLEHQAFAIERDRIAFWRSNLVYLVNCTDGGEGYSGFIRPRGIRLSEAAKLKLSKARQGIRFTDEHRAKLAAKKIGRPRKPFTAKTRRLMREASLIREAEKRRLFGKNVRRTSKIRAT